MHLAFGITEDPVNCRDAEEGRFPIKHNRLLGDERVIADIDNKCCIGNVWAHSREVDAYALPVAINLGKNNPKVQDRIVRSRDDERIAGFQSSVLRKVTAR